MWKINDTPMSKDVGERADRKLSFGTLSCAVVAAALWGAQSASAQQNQPESDKPKLEEIVVTATRVESFASKTPIALTAISGNQLESAGITNPTQLTDAVPNFSIVRANGLQITIRGVTSTDGTEKGDPSAAFLLDGIYIARPQAQEVSFYDIERVEVLRGPQGTLYGRNTTAGVINVLSAEPKFELGGSADVSYESADHIFATGMANVPLGEKVAVRAAVNYDRRDSYIDRQAADSFSIDPFRDNLSTRLSMLFQPTDALKIVVRGDYSTIKGNPFNNVLATNFFVPASIVPSPAPTTADPNIQRYVVNPVYHGSSSDAERSVAIPEQWQGFRDNRERGLMTEVDWNWSDAMSLSYLGSYRRSNTDQHSSIIAGQNRATFVGHYWQDSQELRLAYNSGPWQAQVGAYYFKEESGIAFFILDFFAPGTQFGFPQDPTIAISKAPFGQLTYSITPQLKLTGGVRYSHDDKSRVGATVNDVLPSAGNPGSRTTFQVNNASETFSKMTWRVGVDYDLPDLGLLYATVSTGYKAGGFNDGCEGNGVGTPCASTHDALYYDPETLTAYEGGLKFRLSPSVRLNAAVFHYDYKGLQLSSLVNVCGGPCQVTDNAGKAKVDGVELEGVLRAADHHQFNLSTNYLKARYTEFHPLPYLDFAGRSLDRSPKWTASAGYTFDHSLASGGTLTANALVRYSSRYELMDLAQFVAFYQPSYTKSDVSLTYEAPDARYTVGVFVRNIEDKLPLTAATQANGSSATFQDPRTIGVRAGVKF